jgi:hypothetical protein
VALCLSSQIRSHCTGHLLCSSRLEVHLGVKTPGITTRYIVQRQETLGNSYSQAQGGRHTHLVSGLERVVVVIIFIIIVVVIIIIVINSLIYFIIIIIPMNPKC